MITHFSKPWADLSALEVMIFNQNNITEIPSRAFKPPFGLQKFLTKVYFSGKSIKKLGSNVFTVFPNLNAIYFNKTSIECISENASENF